MNDAMNDRDRPLSWKIHDADNAVQAVVEHIEGAGWSDFTPADETRLQAMLATVGTLLVMRERLRREVA